MILRQILNVAHQHRHRRSRTRFLLLNIRHSSSTFGEFTDIIASSPGRARFGMAKVLSVVGAGVGLGSWLAVRMVAFLEHSEIFYVDEDEEDD